MRLGVDLDGVLARFTDAYGQVIQEVSGITCPRESHHWPSEWYWERALGLTAQQEKEVWEHIHDSPSFWRSLALYDESRAFIGQLRTLAFDGHDIYFITARPGFKAKLQSEQWLHDQGMPHPTVLVTNKKGPIAEALKIDRLIDDRPENLLNVLEHSPSTELYLMDRPWNQDSPFRRVSAPQEML